MIQLDLKNRKSIYEQIVGGFKELISRGILKAGDKLPSVRELSGSLTVNPNTIHKAYRQLEAEEWIYTVSGLGCFVSEKPHDPDRERASGVYEAIGAGIDQLRYMGISDDEILQKITELVRRKGDKR